LQANGCPNEPLCQCSSNQIKRNNFHHEKLNKYKVPNRPFFLRREVKFSDVSALQIAGDIKETPSVASIYDN